MTRRVIGWKNFFVAMNVFALVAANWVFLVCRLSAADLPHGSNYVINVWRTEDGLPDNAVTAILQGREGYLWIGTANGLARFDGVQFTTFRSVNTAALRSNRIVSLYQDPKGALWIGTGGGLTRYAGRHFTAFTTKDGLSSKQVLCAGADAAGRLWVGTATGLDRWDQTRFSSFFSLEGLPDDRINDMTALPSGRLVFATGKGLAEFGGVRFGPFEPAPGMPHDNIRLVLTDGEGNLWLADDGGLWRISAGGRNQGVSQEYAGTVTALAIGTSGEIWFGTAEGSLQRLTAGSTNHPTAEVAHFPSAITALRQDREQDLWLGTASNGLYRLKKRQLRLVTAPADLAGQEVRSLLTLSTNEVWLASSAGTLRCWRGDEVVSFTNREFPDGTIVRALSGGAKSGLWIGTLGDGLFHWKNGQLRHWDELDGLSDNDVEALCADGPEDVWLGTRNGGLNHLHEGRITRFLAPWGFTGHYACVITEDHLGRVWIGTTGDGLFCLSNATFSAYTTQDGLPDDHVRALLADARGVLWVGTAGGLVRLHNQHLTVFTSRNGLPDDGICQLQDDGLGNLWVGCNGGIYRLPKSQMRRFAQGRTRFLDAVSYGEPDGLPVFQCIPGAQAINTGWPGRTFWFATSKGLVRIQPQRIHWNPLPPPVFIQSVLVDDVPVPPTNIIRVPPGRERIEFRYTAVSLVAPEKVRFRCRLSGFDHEWIEMGGKRTAQYTQVPPGHYRFRVVARNNDGVWSPMGASVAVIIAPFWWATTWFKLTVLVVLGIFVFSLVRQRQVRLREMERLRVRIAGDLHDELGSSLWSITLLSQILQKHGQMGEEERRDVGEIHRVARQTSNAIRDIVWIINPAFDTAQDLVQRMKDFAGTMLRGREYHLQCEGLDLSRRLALGFRENIFLMFKEVLTNVAKHAQASVVEIRLEELTDAWRLSVHDNGVGFNPSAPAKGNGLRSLRTRAEKMGATVQIDSKLGNGTTVRLTLPKT